MLAPSPSLRTHLRLRGRIAAYKEGAANCTDPIGQFKNDNVMITNSVICFEDREKARAMAFRKGRRLSGVDGQPYHDTMPKSIGRITWRTRRTA